MAKKRWAALAALPLVLAAPVAAFDYEAERAALLERADDLKANTESLTDAERLQRFIDLYFEYTMLVAPEFATMIGHPTGHDRWSDNSLAENERQEADTRHALEVLQSIDRDALEAEDRLNYDLMMQSVKESVEGQRFRGELLAINQMGGVHQNVARMLAMMPAANVAQYENILARLRGVPELVDHTLEALRTGLEEGVTPPRVTLRDVPQQVENLLVDDPSKSAMLRSFASFPDSVPVAEQERLREEAYEVFTTAVAPAYRKLLAFLSEEYIPGSRESIAASDLPDGQAWYAYRVKQMTTTDMTPQEIHDLGLSEVKRIRAEMDRVIEASGFTGTFEEFTTFLREDPQFYFTEAEDLLTAYRDICKRADAALPALFGTLPRTPYGVTPVPEYAEASQTTAYYQPGSMQAGRAGQFFANTYKLETRPKWEMEALSLHEAVPGHHLQIALAQELENLPWFRRHGGETAFVEGWGLYSESLGEEMGFYQDPYAKFGQLTYEMWRAIRLVVDTGMHALGWSRQQAIDYFLANTGKQEHDIIVEVDRYIVWPGQALAYKIGELKIKELRAHAEQEL
ncbi:MAG: DUF885 domain-containing protein, partial [Thermoanaerobaculia bacterium]|nr:DUF885 domain-containing protein [Thermoanaerobaculia bacterium]